MGADARHPRLLLPGNPANGREEEKDEHRSVPRNGTQATRIENLATNKEFKDEKNAAQTRRVKIFLQLEGL
jgi:hypothetical protein